MTNLSGVSFINFCVPARKFGLIKPKSDDFQLFFGFLRLILFFVFYLSNNNCMPRRAAIDKNALITIIAGSAVFIPAAVYSAITIVSFFKGLSPA